MGGATLLLFVAAVIFPHRLEHRREGGAGDAAIQQRQQTNHSPGGQHDGHEHLRDNSLQFVRCGRDVDCRGHSRQRPGQGSHIQLEQYTGEQQVQQRHMFDDVPIGCGHCALQLGHIFVLQTKLENNDHDLHQ